jgi:hypothetical protein
LAGAAVGLKADGKVAKISLRRRKVADRGAALLDGLGQDLLNLMNEPGRPRHGDPVAAPSRVNSSAPQGFDCVNIPHTSHQLLVEQNRFDGRSSCSEKGRKIAKGGWIERFHSKSRKGWINRFAVGSKPIRESESAGIHQSELAAGVQTHREMGVRHSFVAGQTQHESTGHAEVDQQHS